jgi:DNA helicase II / ATP-dependent DNA helicase PcrA
MIRSKQYMRIQLTPEQEEAAEPHVGKKAVIATAGGGKTTTSAKSIAIKLYGDMGSPVVRDQDIMATTFTRASARDLRKKIDSMAGRVTDVNIGTLHSFCFHLIVRHSARINFPIGTQSIKESEKKMRMESILHSMLVDRGMSPKKYTYADYVLAGNLCDIKAVSSFPEDLGRLAGWKCPELLIKAYEEYKNFQRASGFVDHDTMLVFAHEILKGISSIDEAIAEHIHLPKHVYIDEAQDLSAVQWAIVSELSRLAESITVIGDDDQAIYGWRGATPWRFKKFYEEADHKCLLTSNRRCPEIIVEVGEDILKMIPIERRITKTLKSSKPQQNGRVIACVGLTRKSVRDEVLNIIKEATSTGQVKYQDIAIIYRNTTHILDEYAQALTELEIPYKTLGGKDPMDSDEMKLFRYTLAISSFGPWEGTKEIPSNWIGLMEAVGVSVEAAQSVAGRAIAAGQRPDDFVNAISQSRISHENKETLLHLTSSLKKLRQTNRIVKVEHVSCITAVQKSIENSIQKATNKYEKTLLARGLYNQDDAAKRAQEYLENRINFAESFINNSANVDASELARKLGGGVDDSVDEDENTDVVTLATAHSSKGLEFSIVIVLDVLSDTWPSKSAYKGLKSKDEVVLTQIQDEEARLFYVSVTRAKQNLIFTCPVEGISASQKGREACHYLSPVLQEKINEAILNLGQSPAKMIRLK